MKQQKIYYSSKLLQKQALHFGFQFKRSAAMHKFPNHLFLLHFKAS